jgi:hypothetical protein
MPAVVEMEDERRTGRALQLAGFGEVSESRVAVGKNAYWVGDGERRHGPSGSLGAEVDLHGRAMLSIRRGVGRLRT